MNILADLKPEKVFSYFEEICGIPHGSGNTAMISDYLAGFARDRQLDYLQDDYGNVIIKKQGSPGYEQLDPVILQGHMDMVCACEPDYGIDFQKEGLHLQVRDGQISARGTSLGGDDGIAVAYMLAILDRDDLPHPPLECVFTTDEEVGMLGAAALDMSVLKGRRMINLDSEEEGQFMVSCAGGLTLTTHLPLEREDASGICATLEISGLKGGHSGMEIDKGRGNAILLIGRLLHYLQKEIPIRIISISGGTAENVIPDKASADILARKDDISEIDRLVKDLRQIFRKEYILTDDQVDASFLPEIRPANSRVLTAESSTRLLAALLNLPAGVQKMSFALENLVQTSLNLGKAITTETEILFSYSIRSSVGSEKDHLVEQIGQLMKSLGGSISCSGSYPAWEYRPDSALRRLMVGVFEDRYGHKPESTMIHAGLECGLFSAALKGLDCVSIGPSMKGIHSPDEVLDIASVGRVWDFLLEVLKRMS